MNLGAPGPSLLGTWETMKLRDRGTGLPAQIAADPLLRNDRFAQSPGSPLPPINRWVGRAGGWPVEWWNGPRRFNLTVEAGVGRDGGPGRSGGLERAGLDGRGHRRHHHGGQAGPSGHRSGGPGKCGLQYSCALRNWTAARPGHARGAGLRAQGSRRMPSLAGPGNLPGMLRRAAADAGGLPGQLRLCALRHQSGGRRSGRGLPAHSQLGHSAAAALWRDPPLPARGGRCARHYRDLRRGQSAQLVRQLGVDLRQTRNARDGRERLGYLDRRLAHLHGNGVAGLCLAL